MKAEKKKQDEKEAKIETEAYEPTVLNVEFTFTDELLGTLSEDKEASGEYIAGKNPEGAAKDEMEVIAALPEEIEKPPRTVFNRDAKTGRPFLWDYQIKGFFKDAFEAIIESDRHTQEYLKSIRVTGFLRKRTVDKQIMISPREIYLELAGECKFITRPLRKDSFKGGLVAIATSEAAPAGTKIRLSIKVFNKQLIPIIKEALYFGSEFGIGQWRNSGKGRFTWREV